MADFRGPSILQAEGTGEKRTAGSGLVATFKASEVLPSQGAARAAGATLPAAAAADAASQAVAGLFAAGGNVTRMDDAMHAPAGRSKDGSSSQDSATGVPGSTQRGSPVRDFLAGLSQGAGSAAQALQAAQIAAAAAALTPCEHVGLLPPLLNSGERAAARGGGQRECLLRVGFRNGAGRHATPLECVLPGWRAR